METLRQELIEARRGVPFLPFQENAAFKYAIKAMIRKAAEMGDVDRIHFIRGKESADIYSVRKALDAIEFEKVVEPEWFARKHNRASVDRYKVGYHRKGSGWKPGAKADEVRLQEAKAEFERLDKLGEQWKARRLRELYDELAAKRLKEGRPIDAEEGTMLLNAFDDLVKKEFADTNLSAERNRAHMNVWHWEQANRPENVKTYTAEELVGNEAFGKSLGKEIIRRADSEGSGYIHREGLEIGAEKHIETYDVKVPAIIDKIVKPWGEKARRGKVKKKELTREQKEFRELKEGFEERPDLLDHGSPTIDRYYELREKLKIAGMLDDAARDYPPTAPTTYIDLTPEMQKGVLYSPQALFMPAEKVGKSVIHKNGHGYALMETAKGNWRMYAPGSILVGVSATREAAKLLYERHMLKEMRRQRK